jgi:hypothetical protein
VSLTQYITGLDLGQAADFTALVVLEQTAVRDHRGLEVAHYAARHIERFPLGTGYPAIVSALRERFRGPPLAASLLVVDATGVGRAVVDMIRDGSLAATVSAWTITAGHRIGDRTVPKKDLVGAVQAALGTRRLKIAPELPLSDMLRKELETFRVKVSPDRNETFESWRERDHDDLVLALALAVWRGELIGPPVYTPPPMIIGPKYV